MKLRIRSAETMETLTIEVSDSTRLFDLKWQIANMLSPAVTAGSTSIRLYRNREDDLLDPSFFLSTLHQLGLTSGDLIFFSVASTDPYAAIPTLNPRAPPPTDTMHESVGTLNPKSRHPEEGTSTLTQGDLMEVDSGTPEAYLASEEVRLALENRANCYRKWRDRYVMRAPSTSTSDDPLALDLERVMRAEEGVAMSAVGRLVIAVHAVFLESGFVVSRGGCRLPARWQWLPVAFSIPYTFPDLAAQNDVKVVILKFSAMGKYVSVDGFVRAMREREEDPPHSLRLETVDVLREREKKDVFKQWRTVKDGLALPLLIDFCDKNGLPLPPCFRRLPAELKIKILEFLPGVDVARAACTDSELKYLSSNEELWKQKFVKEFGLLDEREPGLIGCCWRDKFAKCWAKAKDAKKRARLEKLYPYGIPPKA